MIRTIKPAQIELTRADAPRGRFVRFTLFLAVFSAAVAHEALADQAAPVVNSPQATIPSVEFKHLGYEQFGPAGPYEPDRAVRNGVSGFAIIQCGVKADRSLKDCQLVSETPADMGFGPASRALIARGALLAPPDMAIPPADTPVLLEVPFLLPSGDGVKQLYQQGIGLTSAGRLDEAIVAFTTALKARPKYAEAYVGRANAYIHAGQSDLALRDYDQAIALQPKNARAFLGRAAVFFGEADYPRAIQDFDQATANDPKLGRAYQFRALARANTGQGLDLALADCDQALALMPADQGVMSVRSLVQFRLGRFDLAIKDADAALAGGKQSARTQYVRGIAKRRLGDASGSEADITASKAIDPTIATEAAAYGVTP